MKDIDNPRIVALGITYKPDTYDVRNSPAQQIIKILHDDGCEVIAADPLVDGYQYESIKEIAKDADCLVVLVEHKVIKEELAREETEIKQAMRRPVIIRFYPETPENR